MQYHVPSGATMIPKLQTRSSSIMHGRAPAQLPQPKLLIIFVVVEAVVGRRPHGAWARLGSAS